MGRLKLTENNEIGDPVEKITPSSFNLQVRVLATLLEQLRQTNQKLDEIIQLLKKNGGTP